MTEEQTTRSSDWVDGFLFVGNQLALDFLNTRPVQDGEALELLPDFTALLRWYKAAGLLSAHEIANLKSEWGETPQARHTLESLRAFRERLRKQVIDWERDGTIRRSLIDEINRLMEEHPMSAKLRRTGDSITIDSASKPQTPAHLFAPIAQSAAMLFANADRKRVRKCANCILHFVDTSKKGTRRWCSMQLCGNRLKVAAYAARQRGQ